MIKQIPLLSICCITYNHEKYIRDAINGFLMQKTSFPIEIIIHDDCSTDRTGAIIKEYWKEHQNLIYPIFQKENQYSQGKRTLPLATKKAKGKYIAVCEGDDYWTHPLKLQKQVDFLEANADYSMCFHNAIILWEDKSKTPKYFCPNDQKITCTIEDVFKKWFIPTASMVLRKKYINHFPEWIDDVYNGDWAVQMLAANNGKIHYIDETMSIYRKNRGSVSAGIGKNKDYVKNKQIKLLRYFNQHCNYTHRLAIEKTIDSLNKEFKENNLKKRFPTIARLLKPVKTFKNLKRRLS